MAERVTTGREQEYQRVRREEKQREHAAYEAVLRRQQEERERDDEKQAERAAHQKNYDSLVDAEMPRIRVMAVDQMLALLCDLCEAYSTNDHARVRLLEPRATAVARVLDEEGGLSQMRAMYHRIPDQQGKRTLDMHWDGIGDWRG